MTGKTMVHDGAPQLQGIHPQVPQKSFFDYYRLVNSEEIWGVPYFENPPYQAIVRKSPWDTLVN